MYAIIAQANYNSDVEYQSCGSFMSGFWFSWIFLIIFLALVVVVVSFALKAIFEKNSKISYDSLLREKTISEILDEKCEKGEISEEKCKQLKKDLKKKNKT